MSKYKSKKKNNKRSHDQGKIGFGYLMNVSGFEMAKQTARPKKTKLGKLVRKVLGKLKRGDR